MGQRILFLLSKFSCRHLSSLVVATFRPWAYKWCGDQGLATAKGYGRQSILTFALLFPKLTLFLSLAVGTEQKGANTVVKATVGS